jgi:hypothetical protein
MSTTTNEDTVTARRASSSSSATKDPFEDPFARLLEARHQISVWTALMLAEGRRLHYEEGVTFAALGNALGVTRQAAYERYARR